MPPITRKKRQVVLDESDDELGYESDYESCDDEMVYVFQNLTPVGLRDGKRIQWSDEAKTLVLRHAASYMYSAKSLPDVATFFDLAQQLGVPFYLGKRSAKACLEKLASLITRLVSTQTLRPALIEKPLDSGVWECTWATWPHEVFATPEFSVNNCQQSGWLEEQHQAAGAAYHPSNASKPTSALTLVRQTLSHLVATQFIRKPGDWLSQVPQTVTPTPNPRTMPTAPPPTAFPRTTPQPSPFPRTTPATTQPPLFPRTIPTAKPSTAFARTTPAATQPTPFLRTMPTATQSASFLRTTPAATQPTPSLRTMPTATLSASDPRTTPVTTQPAPILRTSLKTTRRTNTAAPQTSSMAPTAAAYIADQTTSSKPLATDLEQQQAFLVMTYTLQRLTKQSAKMDLLPHEDDLADELYALVQTQPFSHARDYVSELLECCRKHPLLLAMIKQCRSQYTKLGQGELTTSVGFAF